MTTKVKTAITVTLDAYEQFDCVGALVTATIGEASLLSNQGYIIRKIMLTDASVQSEKLNIHFFNASPAEGARTDAATFAPVAADIAKCVHVEYIADSDYIAASVYHSVAIKHPNAYIECDGLDLFIVLEALETPDYAAAGDLELTLYLERV